jgi:hypothetical protein
MGVISTNSHVCVHKLCSLCVRSQEFNSQQPGQRGKRMKNTVRNDATSSNLKGKPMTKTIGLHWLQQVTKHVPATDEASVIVHRGEESTTACKVGLILLTHNIPSYFFVETWGPSHGRAKRERTEMASTALATGRRRTTLSMLKRRLQIWTTVAPRKRPF